MSRAAFLLNFWSVLQGKMSFSQGSQNHVIPQPGGSVGVGSMDRGGSLNFGTNKNDSSVQSQHDFLFFFRIQERKHQLKIKKLKKLILLFCKKTIHFT